MKPEEFANKFELSEKQIQQFETYFALLIDWNEKINLTTITDKEEVYLKHFDDSVAPIKFGLIKNEKVKLLDIGAGAGFPSLPMKILYPEIEVTIIDSLNKRINFLKLLTEKLNLENITLLHGRAEDFGKDKDYRGHYDFVTARAVARLNILTELTLPFLKKQGQLLSFKATKFDEELADARTAITTLGGKFEKSIDYELIDGSKRHIAIIKKCLDTPNKYPRKSGTPNKNPL
ncbi:16S rRNA (guanine(527)-N(7))-methyltransferase RsmG [Lactovum miscens]|uniref:Ribosomal RNA small subunit methyltransferase G n=1 Tax=Lactovum miscens TaxID=190387 RepID=A0A841C9H8_9LACT|nr:16S rRNA (guanine(527)-N(7))-methyltransferase RsmG [Lactovum miscens]MBB5887850.1 16S rRNA (guanine527-N7)-methyltransferase [Lactovum miscens]